MDIRKLFERVEADGIITKDEIKEINAAMMKDGVLDFEERGLLQKMTEKLKNGELEEVRVLQ